MIYKAFLKGQHLITFRKSEQLTEGHLVKIGQDLFVVTSAEMTRLDLTNTDDSEISINLIKSAEVVEV